MKYWLWTPKVPDPELEAEFNRMISEGKSATEIAQTLWTVKRIGFLHRLYLAIKTKLTKHDKRTKNGGNRKKN